MKVLFNPAAVVLVAECEAFLDGRYAELVEDAGAPAPPWAWMNLLAHGTEDERRDAAARLGDSHGWRQARAFVAGEMLDAIESRLTTLRALQAQVLVPLELDVLECRDACRWTPGQLAYGLLKFIPSRGRYLRT